ncbi:MAG TPA: MFS transporter, partial [Candidatus Bipolaricaulota bacterium]
MKGPALYFGLTVFFVGFGNYSFSLLIPILVVDRAGYSFSELALVLTSYSLAVILFGPLWGYLSDKIGRRRPIIILGYCIFSLSSIFYVFADALPAYMVLRFLQGVGMAAHPMVTALFSDFFGAEAAKRFGLYSGIEAVGWGLGGIGAGTLADLMGIKAVFLIAAVFPLISAALAY